MSALTSRIRSLPSFPTSLRFATWAKVRCGIGIAISFDHRDGANARSRRCAGGSRLSRPLPPTLLWKGPISRSAWRSWRPTRRWDAGREGHAWRAEGTRPGGSADGGRLRRGRERPKVGRDRSGPGRDDIPLPEVARRQDALRHREERHDPPPPRLGGVARPDRAEKALVPAGMARGREPLDILSAS